MKNKKAFLLFEATLTIAILSLGLVFVVRSIGSSVKVARSNSNYISALNLAYHKLFELELASGIEGIESTQDEGNFESNDRFNWKYQTEGYEGAKLAKVKLAMSWKEAKRDAGFDINTYLNTKE